MGHNISICNLQLITDVNVHGKQGLLISVYKGSTINHLEGGGRGPDFRDCNFFALPLFSFFFSETF